MLNIPTDKFFWFTPPSTILSNADKNLGYIFVALLVLGIIFRVFQWLSKNPVNRQLFQKLWHLFFSTGISGLIWFGIRYENTQIFSQRYWAGLTLVIGIIWLLFILKFLIFNYRGQKKEYDRELVKNKYLPGPKSK